jgi:hypothetical protein
MKKPVPTKKAKAEAIPAAREGGNAAIVEALCSMIRELDGAIVSEPKYGGLLFGRATHFCGVFSYTKHVSLEFGDGATLPDPHGVLEGAGKGRRHIKLFTIGDLAAKHVREYLVAANQAATARGHEPPPSKP